MTTAKPQHGNDQSDAADDLIAELAKLMAQDAQGDRAQQQEDRGEAADEDHARKAEPAPATSNTFAFRLPGDAAPAQVAESSAHTVVAQPEPESASSEHDVIAELIEAELSAQPPAETRGAEPQAPVVPSPSEPHTADASHQHGGDVFKVAPVFGLSGPSSPVDSAPSRTELVAAAQARQPEPARQPQLEPQDGANADPLDAIESLIGNAVRAEVVREPAASPAEPGSSNPSPALRSLATPVMPSARQPEPAAQTPEPAHALSAEDAILAAAAATGAEVGWVDPQESAAEEYVAEDAPLRRAPRRNLRAYAGPAVAVVALLAAGIGLYTVLGMGTPDGPPPLLTADATPVKEVPAAAPAAEAVPESVVFNEIAGTETPAEDEQLVSRDQSQMASIAGTPPDAGATDASDEGLVNRKVRTVTVRPDGTIVGGEDALAGIAMLPVERPDVPELPGAAPPADTAAVPATAAPSTSGNAPAAAAEGATVETAALTPGANALTGSPVTTDATATTDAANAAVPAENLLVPGQPATAVDAEGNEIAGRTAPVPMGPIDRPSEPTGAPLAVAASPVNALVDPAAQTSATLPQQQPAATTQTAATQPAAATQAPDAAVDDSPDTLAELISAWSNDNQEPVQPAEAAQPAATQTAATAPAQQATSQAPAYVQLSSQRSAEAAQQTVTTLQNRYGSLFGGTPLEVQRVDLGDRGVYYRVRLPAQSLDSATQICNSVKANGGDCFTL